MALAVAEAHRVLRPGGELLDLHPQGVPLRLELWRARESALPESHDPEAFERQVLGDLAPEAMADDFAATTRAIASAGQQGFELSETVDFDYRFFFDTLDDLTTYLEENEELDLAGDDLLERALLGLQASATPAVLVLVQPVVVTRLKKE
jgi:hypothetical protein